MTFSWRSFYFAATGTTRLMTVSHMSSSTRWPKTSSHSCKRSATLPGSLSSVAEMFYALVRCCESVVMATTQLSGKGQNLTPCQNTLTDLQSPELASLIAGEFLIESDRLKGHGHGVTRGTSGSRLSVSGADSMGYGRHVPQLLQMAGHGGGAQWVEEQ